MTSKSKVLPLLIILVLLITNVKADSTEQYSKVTSEDHPIVTLIVYYFACIGTGNVYGASKCFIYSKQDKMYSVLKKISNETQYYRVPTIWGLDLNGSKATVYLTIVQKRYHVYYEEVWDIEMKLRIEDGYWKIVSSKGI